MATSSQRGQAVASWVAALDALVATGMGAEPAVLINVVDHTGEAIVDYLARSECDIPSVFCKGNMYWTDLMPQYKKDKWLVDCEDAIDPKEFSIARIVATNALGVALNNKAARWVIIFSRVCIGLSLCPFPSAHLLVSSNPPRVLRSGRKSEGDERWKLRFSSDWYHLPLPGSDN